MGKKIALLSDIHFGVKKSVDYFLNSQLEFFKTLFIPYLKANNIKDVYILGDLMDNRNHINVKVLNTVYNLFNDDLADYNVTILIGNHDSHYKNSIKTHSLKFLEQLKNVTIVDEIVYFEELGKSFLLVPWITSSEDYIKELSNNYVDIDYCFGHFEMSGFSLNQYMINRKGLDPNVQFDICKHTFSGHYHSRSERIRNGNIIQYLGSPYQITRNDRDDEKGFTVLDIETGEYENIDNNVSIQFKEIRFPEQFDESLVAGNIIDVLVDYDENYREDLVQKYIQIIEKYKPAFPPVMKIENKLLSGKVLEIEQQTVEELLKEYVESLELENHDEIYAELVELLKQCSRG